MPLQKLMLLELSQTKQRSIKDLTMVCFLPPPPSSDRVLIYSAGVSKLMAILPPYRCNYWDSRQTTITPCSCWLSVSHVRSAKVNPRAFLLPSAY